MNDTKPGYLTTEFWLTAIPLAISILVMVGLFTPDDADKWQEVALKLIPLIFSSGLIWNYQTNRSRVKVATKTIEK